MGGVPAVQSMFHCTPPTARGQAMQQDDLFLQTHLETCVAARVAVDDVDGENGGLKVVPRSHPFELRCPEPADEEESFTPPQPLPQ